MPLAAGTKLGPYEILSALGAGGMGEVWKARDTRLHRIVAIKQLKGPHSGRFEQEARAIAALNHPHICTLYDIGPDYLVMEYIDGTSPRGPVAAGDAVRWATQIAGALEAAHQQGILHRDLKPANVLISGGSAKLLDFGLATQADQVGREVTRTSEGAVVGTVAYMSPEQTQGRPLDARSEVFSFGAVLYELLAGARPFPGDSAAEVMSGVLRDEPRPLAAPDAIARIVTRCLRKDPAERFQSMTEVKAALERVTAAPAEHAASIAVLPFADMSPDKDNEYFSDGLAEEIINALAQIPRLKVIARTSAFAFKGQHIDIRRIAETLGVAHVLEGSVRKAGHRIRVTTQLITASDGSHLWSERYDRELADVFEVQDDIARAIAGALKARLGTGAAAARQHTPAVPAYEAFLKGRHHQWKLTPESLRRSQKYFEDAIAADPAYALAHSGLSLSYFMLAMFSLLRPHDAMPRARDAAQHALDLNGSLQEAHAMLGLVAALYDYDWREAARRFDAAMSREPVPPSVRSAYGLFYLMYQGRSREAVDELEHALKDDPLSVALHYQLGVALLAVGRDRDGTARLRGALELDERFMTPYVVLGFMHTRQRRFPEALAEAEQAYALASWDPVVVGLLAAVLVHTGDEARARHILAPLEDGSGPGAPIGQAVFHLLCDNVERAADFMTRAIEERYPGILFFVNGPIGAALRASGRWPALKHRLNLPDDRP